MHEATFWGVAENGEVAEVVVAEHLAGELLSRWPPVGLELVADPRGPVGARLGLSNDWLIVPGEGELGDSPPAAAWDLMEQTLALFAAHRLKHLVPVHSAAIAWHGSVLVVPAPSGGGKSTLAVAAADFGAAVLSDEYTLIDPSTGLVTGWTRRVRVRLADGTTERLDLSTPADPLPVGLVAIVSHEPRGASAWSRISPADATLEIIRHTVCARTRPDHALDAAMAIASSAPAVAGVRGDAAAAILDLLGLMDERSGAGVSGLEMTQPAS